MPSVHGPCSWIFQMNTQQHVPAIGNTKEMHYPCRKEFIFQWGRLAWRRTFSGKWGLGLITSPGRSNGTTRKDALPADFQGPQGRHMGENRWGGSFKWPRAQRQLGWPEEGAAPETCSPFPGLTLGLVKTLDAMWTNSPHLSWEESLRTYLKFFCSVCSWKGCLGGRTTMRPL